MTYSEVTEWLYQQIPNFHKTGGQAYKPGLERMDALLKAFGHPEKDLKCIHIAGTNGKGSVAHILAAIFQQHGYKTGLFTSPHIHDFRERIKVNGDYISKEKVTEFIAKNTSLFQSLDASFFEITTALAFEYLHQVNCDIAIIETGLGGRLDATNVIPSPLLSIITTIGKDHEQFLGNSLPEIAQEKAGIIKKNSPVVLGQIQAELIPIFEEKAKANDCPIYLADSIPPIPTDLLGEYQQKNIQTALKAISVLKDAWILKDSFTHEALKQVRTLTRFQGRFQQLGEHPLIIADAAHNPIGIEVLMDSVSHQPHDKLRIIYGAANDKKYEEILSLFPREAVLYLTTFHAARSVQTDEWVKVSKQIDLSCQIFEQSNEALKQAKKDANETDIILICGSFYLLEELINPASKTSL
jgi:dihydrofolate synthase/folylpolyglutamate synthase